MPNIQRAIENIHDITSALKSELDELEKRVIILETEVANLIVSPAPRRGERLPPTPLPDTLKELEIGTTPRGT
jgi:hypothetical protein